MSKYYDRNGTPIDVAAFARLFDGDAYRRVAETLLVDGTRVSTVWLGLDHAFGHGAPLIFETMVFGGPLDQEQTRYSTLADAEAGHVLMVERVRRAPGQAS